MDTTIPELPVNPEQEPAQPELKTLLLGQLHVLVQERSEKGLKLAEIEQEGDTFLCVLCGPLSKFDEPAGEPERVDAVKLYGMTRQPAPAGLSMYTPVGVLNVRLSEFRFQVALLCAGLVERAFLLGALPWKDFGREFLTAFEFAGISVMGRAGSNGDRTVDVRFLTETDSSFDLWPDVLRALARDHAAMRLHLAGGVIVIPASGVAELASQFWKISP